MEPGENIGNWANEKAWIAPSVENTFLYT
jgi:hypothetical protein